MGGWRRGGRREEEEEEFLVRSRIVGGWSRGRRGRLYGGRERGDFVRGVVE